MYALSGPGTALVGMQGQGYLFNIVAAVGKPDSFHIFYLASDHRILITPSMETWKRQSMHATGMSFATLQGPVLPRA
jgi:hypothetical protein